MKKFLYFLFLYLFNYIKNATMYHCARYSSMQDQCMFKYVDRQGNIKIDLWKCPTNKYCHILQRKYDEDSSIGVCVYNYKKLYDGDSCTHDSECASSNCTKYKCSGFSIGEFCRQNFFQCKNDLVCKNEKEILPYGEKKDVYKCRKLGQLNETCDNNNECDINLVCANSSIYEIMNFINNNNISNVLEIKNKINFNDYILFKKNFTKICMKRAELDNGFPTSEPMVCKSGDSMDIEIFHNYKESICVSKKQIIKNCNKNNTCMIKVNLGNFSEIEATQDCMISMIGNSFCPLNEKENAWKRYLNIYNYYYLSKNVEERRETVHIPVYKDTFNDYDVSKAFWNYVEWQYNIEADSCTKDFFFLNNKNKFINLSLLYLLYKFLFLL